jgi:hypothetical protein
VRRERAERGREGRERAHGVRGVWGGEGGEGRGSVGAGGLVRRTGVSTALTGGGGDASFLGDVGAASFSRRSNNFEGVGSGAAASCSGSSSSGLARASNGFVELMIPGVMLGPARRGAGVLDRAFT